MVDSTDATVVRGNGYASPDEQRYALNAVPIRRLIGRNGSAMGEYAPAGIDQLSRLSSPLYGWLLPDGNINQAFIMHG